MTARRRVVFGGFGDYPNLLAAPSVIGTFAAVAAGLPLTNLQTDEPSEVARLLTIDPRYTILQGVFDYGSIPFDLVSLVNVNLSAWALWRVYGQKFPIDRDTSLPDTVTGVSNATGAVTNVDENVSTGTGATNTDGLFIVPTDPTQTWSARFTFATPAHTPKTGTARAYFVLRVAAVLGSGGAASVYPSLRVELYESGSMKLDLGYRAVSGSDQVLIYAFDPALLTTASGANIEALVTSEPYNGGSTPLSSYAKLDAINLVTEYESNAPAGNSGWISMPWSSIDSTRLQPQKTLHYEWASQLTERGLFVEILDDQTNHFTRVGPYSAAVVTTPSGFTQAGVLLVARGLFLENGLMGAPSPRVIIEGAQGNTAGGQTYAADMFRRRGVSVNAIFTEDELNAVTRGIDWERGHAGAFFAAFRANLDPEYQVWDAGWWTMTEAGEPAQLSDDYVAGGSTLFTKAYTLEEKL